MALTYGVKMKLFFICMALMFTAMTANANFDRRPQNIKLPTQYMIEHQRISAPATASATLVLSAYAGDTSGAGATTTTFLAQPDVARNLVVTPGSTTADVKAGSVVISGKNIRGESISESFVFIDNQSSAVTGNKAFKTVTSITFPAEDSPYGATWSVGTGTKLGINKCLAAAGYYIKGLVDGADLTGSTVAAGASAIESNTVIPNPAPNSSRVFDLMFVQNWVCD